MKKITTNKLAGSLLALGLLAAASNQATAATWANTLADGDINNAGNWTGGLPSATIGAEVASTTLVINQAFSNGNVTHLITGTGGMTIESGGVFAVDNATLLGSTILTGNGGPSTITHTGGTLTLNNLIALGHHAVATYNISGGNLIAQGISSLDIVYTGGGGIPAASAGSSLNISGTGQVDIETGKGFAINAGGTLDVTGGGLLVWHDRTVAETASFAGTVNATITQVGSDVHFTVGVADTTPPTIVLPTSPADEASGVLVSSDLVATFDENIALTGVGTVTIRDLEAGPDVVIDLSVVDPDGSVAVSGTVLTISPTSDLVTNNDYAIQISADAIVDLAAAPNAFAGILDDTTWNFQTAAVDTTDPTLVLPTIPADDAVDVTTNSLVATFSEPIMVGSGDITIKNLTAATETTIAVSDSLQVSIVGDVLTVTPDTGFELNSDYAIQIGASAITDLSGNPFDGILVDTTWNFTTETAVPIAIGTKIGLAPGPTATDDAGNDWFDFAATNTTYNAIHDLDGDIVDGVSVQVTGGVFNTSGEDNWVGLSSNGGSAPAEFVDSVTTDLLFANATITITGLDTGLSYDIYSVSQGGGAGLDSREDTHTVTGDVVYGPSTVNRGDARTNGTFHTFLGVSPDGSGQIVLATTGPQNNPAFNGLLIEAKEAGAVPGYAGWAGLFAGFTTTDPEVDFEGDGLASGVEWVVDGDPTAHDASSVSPTFDNSTDPNDFLFTFRRRDDAEADPNTTIVVEYGSNLTGWTPADAGWISVDDNGFGTSAIDGEGVDKVTVAIPRALAVDGKLFARLKVTVAP